MRITYRQLPICTLNRKETRSWRTLDTFRAELRDTLQSLADTSGETVTLFASLECAGLLLQEFVPTK